VRPVKRMVSRQVKKDWRAREDLGSGSNINP